MRRDKISRLPDGLLDRLSSAATIKGEAAVRELANLPPGVIPVVIKEAIYYMRFSKPLIGGMIGATLLGFLSLGAGSSRVNGIGTTLFVVFISSAIAFGFSTLVYADIAKQRIFSRITSLLKTWKQPDCLYALLDVTKVIPGGSAYFEHNNFAKAINSALEHIVPTIDQAIYDSLTSEQKKLLLCLLDKPYANAELCLQLIGIFGECAEPNNPKLVSRLEAYIHWGDSSTIKRFQDAARTALQKIEQRSAQNREAHTLLRGSSLSPATQSDVLLRPAASHEQTPNEHLLRAANSDDPSSRL